MELTRMQMIERAIQAGAPMTLPEILEEEIKAFRASDQYKVIVTAEEYYRNRSDVQNKTNEVAQRSNVKMEHSFLRKLVDQKANYLLSKPWTVQSDDEGYAKAIGELFDEHFRQRIKSMGTGAVKSGIAWLAPYFDDGGRLRVMRLPTAEVIPLWRDAEHTRPSGYIRFYNQEVYEGRERRTVMRVELWDSTGVKYFRNDGRGGTALRPDTDAGDAQQVHFKVGDKGYNWENVPLVYLKYNEDELPLWYFIKDLIDDINWQKSVTADVLRDVAKFVYILKNYGGQDLAEFVSDLKKHLAIKVEGDGGVDKLQADINVEAVMSFLQANRKDLFDLAAAVDTKDVDLGNASGIAINFRYMDLDTDCTNLAAGLQDTFLQLKPFLDAALQLGGKGDFAKASFSVVFNTDMPVNEGDVIGNVVKSEGVVSRRTLLEQHPWVTDVDEEIKRLDEDAKAKAATEPTAVPFGQQPDNAASGGTE